MASSAPSTAGINKSFSQMVDGFRIPGGYSADRFRSAVNYRPRDDDLFVVTYPKCGTTWAQQILYLLFREGEGSVSDYLALKRDSPFLEATGATAAEAMRRPGAIKIHLPYHLAPRSDKAKYIYIARNPKDCCISYYYHMKNNPRNRFYGSFDNFLEMFISGEIDFGDYYEHLLGWYDRRNDPNVLFVTYEEMKADPKAAILKMASFVDDKQYAEPLRNYPQKLDNMVRHSSFEYMKSVFNKNKDEMLSMSKEDILAAADIPDSVKEMFVDIAELRKSGDSKGDSSHFVRKGIVGDWKNHLSSEQNKRMDEIFAERTKGTEIPDIWKNAM